MPVTTMFMFLILTRNNSAISAILICRLQMFPIWTRLKFYRMVNLMIPLFLHQEDCLLEALWLLQLYIVVLLFPKMLSVRCKIQFCNLKAALRLYILFILILPTVSPYAFDLVQKKFSTSP